MDYYQPNYNQPYTQPPKNTLATVSCILGVCSLILMCTGILPIPLGALGIIFAVLSRKNGRMPQPAGLGCALSCAGLVSGLFITAVIYIGTIIAAFSNVDPQKLSDMDQKEAMDYMMESIYGPEYKEFFEQNGINYDALMDQLGGGQ